MSQVKSGYILAGFETLAGILNNFIANDSKGRYDNNFTAQEISNLLSTTVSGFLHSYGDKFAGRKKYGKYNQSEADLYQRCRGFGFFNNSNFIADSGGFQISIGRLDRRESDLLLDMYHDFLIEHHQVLDRAFTLDIPPGPNCDIFKDFDDIYRLNSASYLKAANLPDEVRRKMIYVHHFRSPKLWDVFKRILTDTEIYPQFENFATGGIVASMSGDTAIPCIIYLLPLIPLLKETIKYKRNYLNFHILGGANYRDILFYELFKLQVKKIHNIELNITYDSSGLYKGLMIGRFLHVMGGNGIIRKMNIRSSHLGMRFENDMTINDKYGMELNKFARKYNFKEIDMSSPYDPVADTFYEEVKIYSMLYMLDFYSVMQTRLREQVAEIFPLYEAGDYMEFNNQIENITRFINEGKITRKQKAKSTSVITSLDMLRDLDETRCKYIVDKCLSKDEFTNLISSEEILTI